MAFHVALNTYCPNANPTESCQRHPGKTQSELYHNDPQPRSHKFVAGDPRYKSGKTVENLPRAINVVVCATKEMLVFFIIIFTEIQIH